jgi:hypothetical protein
MSQDKIPNWLTAENERAEELTEIGGTTNNTAPRMVKVERAPDRKQKAFFIQPSYAEAFEDFALAQKRLKGGKGKKATELAEEMIFDLLTKYKADTSRL